MSIYKSLLLSLLLAILWGPNLLRAQSLRKMQKRAINRTHLTAVNGDTVQRFTITMRHPAAKLQRMYYWQGNNRILRTQGAYNGKLLHGPYQLTNRSEQLLGSGTFSKGLKTGLWRTWRPDGTLSSSRHWFRGRPRGRSVEYDENGLPLRKPAPAKVGAAVARWWKPASWKRRPEKASPPPVAPLPAATVSTASPTPGVQAAPEVKAEVKAPPVPEVKAPLVPEVKPEPKQQAAKSAKKHWWQPGAKAKASPPKP